MKKTIFSLLAVMAMALGFVSCNDDKDEPAPSAAFQYALDQVYPGATGVKWEKKAAWQVAEFDQNGAEYDVWFNALTVEWAMTEIDYGKNIMSVPDLPVLKAIEQSEYGMWTLDDISYYQQTAMSFYIAEMETAGKPDTDLYIAPDGKIIKIIPSSQTPDITPNTDIRPALNIEEVE